MDHNAHNRRPPFNRGRRGPDRRGTERRTTPPAQEPSGRGSGDQTDVEQIMREIRTRISQRHGIDLTVQQIQELAARRLEAILDPRTVNPSLLAQLRGAAASPDATPAVPEPGYVFEDTTLFETHRGILRFIRRLLNPILLLFFNPQPLAHALNTQARLNKEAAVREAARDQRQAEWNALHYELLQRLVTEGARLSIEMQGLALRVESLATRVDFNDRRVRSFENTAPTPPPRSHSRPIDAAPVPAPAPAAVAASVPPPASSDGVATTDAGTGQAPAADGTRRRRRRRRGRRSGTGPADGAGATGAALNGDPGNGNGFDDDEAAGDDGPEGAVDDSPAQASPEPLALSPVTSAAESAPSAQPEPPAQPEAPVQPAPPRDEPTTAPEPSDPGPPDR